jgi:hypothetical protein
MMKVKMLLKKSENKIMSNDLHREIHSFNNN